MARRRRFNLTGRRVMLFSLSGLVALFLLASAVLTLQVYLQLDEYRSAPSDDLAFTVSRLEVDHTRLILAAQTLSVSTEPLERQATQDLRRRFDAFYNRAAILREGPAYAEALDGAPTDALERIAEALRRLEPLIDGPDAALRDAAPQVEAQVRAMTGDVNAVARAAVVLDGSLMEMQRERLTDKLIELAILSTLMLLTMVTLLVQLWRLYTRYRRRALDNRATLNRVSTILNTALDTIVVVDAQSRIVDANATAEDTFGLRDADGALKSIDAVLLRRGDEGEDPVPVTGEMLIASCREGPNRCTKLLARDKHGTLFPVEISADVAWQDGRQVCVCYLRDISRRLEAETEMQAARDRALAGEQAKARFLGMISHEMRTPLNGILGTLDLLEDSALTDEQRHYTKIIHNAGQQLLTQINDALDLAQAGAGELALNVARFDLDALIEEAVAGQMPMAEAGGTALRGPAPEVRLGMVEGDRTRVLQVLVNLVSNAVKFTQGGEVTVEAVRPDPDAPLVEIQIADTGRGIAEADLPRIFDDFVRVAPSNGEDVPGSGLGLGIVRELVTAMGGTVGAESIPGEGSLFWVSLPLPRAETRGTAAAEEPDRDRGDGVVPHVTPLEILVAEDNETNRFVLCEMLRKDGHRVRAVADGIEAVKMAEAQRFDVMLMDVRMPRMDGIAAARRIRDGGGPSQAARLIFLTAQIDLAPAQFAGLKAEAVLPKPLRLTTLRAALAGTFRAEEMRRTALPGPVDPQVVAQLRQTLRPARFEDVLSRFIAEGEAFIARLSALQAGPKAALGAALHQFAGSASTFGAARLQGALGRAEAALQAGDEKRAEALLASLPALWAETVDALRAERSAA